MTRLRAAALCAAAYFACTIAITGVPTSALAGVNLGNVPIANSGWRYNMTVMREKAKTDSFKAKQYKYYLDKHNLTDAWVVAYAAAVDAKYNGGSSSSGSSSSGSSSGSSSSVNLGNVPIANSGWRYNMTVMREKAKTDAFKATQYKYYLDKHNLTDAWVAAYAAAVDAKYNGGSSSSGSSSSGSNSGSSSSGSTSSGGRKPIYNGFRYYKMPSFAGCGLSGIKIFYDNELFGSGSKSKPNISQLKNVVIPKILKNKYQYAVIDIEHWDTFKEMDKLITVAKTIRDGIRAKGGKTKIGYYLLIPDKNWYAPVQNSSSKMKSWKATNDKLAPLVKHVDVIFPSLYTMFDNKSDWIKYAKGNIAEARQYGKPVIAFIWPQIHNWNSTDGQKYMSGSFWKTQLETVHGLADGTVIWGSMTTKKGKRGWDTWRSGMPWWQVTKEFAKAKGTAKFSGCKA
ncbi:hypothetical protein [Geminicoccus roseus]|uniref:hypothetical protein n=1 Tax=Geminicoccus roseus TaxID=404900 RepID=UPI0012F8490D|nr:hypothetical protein [Geminicoccus roseus]